MPEFMEHLKAAVAALRVGDPLEESTQLGPLISQRQRERVAGYVHGAPVALQGSASDGRGFWFPPTVLHPIEDEHRAVREEIFGPVACVPAFDGEDDAGARALEIGALAINTYTSVRGLTPFGGSKQSGIERELGADATEAYSELENVFLGHRGPVEEFRYACCGTSAAPRATRDAHVPEARSTIARGPRHRRLRDIGRTDHSATNP